MMSDSDTLPAEYPSRSSPSPAGRAPTEFRRANEQIKFKNQVRSTKMFGRSTSSRFSESKTITPGPGEYDAEKIQASTKKGISFGIGERKFSHIQSSEFAHLGPGLYSVRTDSKIFREASCTYTASNFDMPSAIRKIGLSCQKLYGNGQTDKPPLKTKEVMRCHPQDSCSANKKNNLACLNPIAFFLPGRCNVYEQGDCRKFERQR
jgi:hypothetical protein